VESEGEKQRRGKVREVDAVGADCSPLPPYHRPNLLSEGREMDVFSTRSCPALLELQHGYEAIRVWSYTTFIVNEAVVNRKLAVET
jgi:hypothetical protein